ncbi:uncharacterized protein LOC132200009 [Neocloeon triangulifer]|uniref:uncharacterized protein LOC132200009 n=1 Tax=Neocloeon triangulifer TaxID=2078957 RepID=UPI00286F5D89|nr:uncharacterized protein LOC132200009 [Neocloeon triangulifer]
MAGPYSAVKAPTSVLEEELMDFENAATHYNADECWTLSELDDEALQSIVSTKTSSGTSSSSSATGSNRCLNPISTNVSPKIPPPSSPLQSAVTPSTLVVSPLLSSLPASRLPTMKIDSSETTTSSSDSIFGCVRFGSTNAYINKTGRPSMISAKYRLKEERRKVLKISIGKFKRIEDHESSLRRSVLINNTMKRLQKEAREEKLQRQGIFQINSAFSAPELDLKPTVLEPAVEKVPQSNQRKRSISTDDCEDCDVQDVLSHFYMPPTPRLLTSIDDEDDMQVPNKKQRVMLEEEPQNENINIIQLPSVPKESLNNNSNSADDLMKKCETEKPTPITQVKIAADDIVMADEAELDVVNTSDDDRLVVCEEPLLDTPPSSCSDSEDEDIDVVNSDNDERLRPSQVEAERTGGAASGESANDSSDQQHFSCGHTSIFGELQSVVFHSLIASLES